MPARSLVVVCWVLILGIAPRAQAPADPVSGRWGTDGAPFFELQFDGTRGVTGVVYWRGDGEALRAPIAAGVYDVKRRALRLEGEARLPDGGGGKYVIEGTVEGDVVSGRYRFGERSGDFRFVRLPSGPTAAELDARMEARKADFDYLLGEWEFTVDSKEFGKGRGYWTAVRLDTGQILDEYRVVGDNGETYYVTTTLRNYNRYLDRWELIGSEAGGGLQDFGTGRRVGEEMHLEQKFGVASAEPFTLRIRYYDIRADRFSWTADRSNDGGRTWEKGHVRIEARRLAPARSLAPFAPARRKTDAPAAPVPRAHR